MGPSLDLSLISSWLMICDKQGPKSGSLFSVCSFNFAVQLIAVCCDVPVVCYKDAHKYQPQIKPSALVSLSTVSLSIAMCHFTG